MAFLLSTCFMVIVGLFIFSTKLPAISAEPQVPCYFIFGDSLVDNGNNNGLKTLAKVNYPPYGIDFQGGPTGRFTNGKNLADFIGNHLGFDDYIPPFSTAKGSQITKGVNYASGSSGILDETGSQLGENICLNKQLINHGTIVSQIASILGNENSAKEHLGKCLYNVVIGSNDYINNYLLPEFFNSSKVYSPDQYAALLIEQYSQRLTTLFNHGARKVAVFGLGPIGCTPAMIATHKNGSPVTCVDSVNDAVRLFNKRLIGLVDGLNNNLTGAKFIYIDDYTMPDPARLGVRILNWPCCRVSAVGLCLPGQPACNLRDVSLFWDAFHPTQTVNAIEAERSYNAMKASGILSN